MQGGRSEFDIKDWFASAQGCLGMCPWEAGEFFIFESGIMQFGKYF